MTKRLIFFFLAVVTASLCFGNRVANKTSGGGVTVPSPTYQWDFNENSGTTATDSIASATLTLHPTDSTWGTPHKGASSVGFVGSGTNKADGTDILDQYRTGTFTISMWLYATSLASNPVIFVNGGGYQSAGCYIQVTSGGAVVFITNQSGANQASFTGAAVSTGAWYHLCFTRNGASVKIYVNGVDSTSTSASHVDPAATSGTMHIGAYASLSTPLTGFIDQLYFYNVELSAAEVAQLYINTQ